MLALFEATESHPMIPQQTGIAFSVDVEVFCDFARSLPGELNGPDGQQLMPDDVVDFDLCWAFNFADPWVSQYELNCYEYDRIKADLMEADGLDPTRYWPPGLRPQE